MDLRQHLYWDILSPTKSLPDNFRFVSSWDLLPRFLRLYMIEFFCLQYLNFTITLSDLFIRWQAAKSLGITLTPVSGNALQMFSSKRFSVISVGAGFNSIFSFLLYWELVTALRSNLMILVSNTAQKMKFSIKDFFSKCEQIRRKLRIWSHLLKKSLMENFIFCAV